MAQILLSLLISLLAGMAALMLGLTGSALRTGWLDPLDWLLPGTAMALFLIWRTKDRRDGRALAAIWAITALPALLFLTLAGMSLPWGGLIALALGLGLVAAAAPHVFALAPVPRIGALALLVGASFLAPHLGRFAGDGEVSDRPVVAVLSAIPLQGVAMEAAHGLPPIEAVGLRSPLWTGLEHRFVLQPLDALDGTSLDVAPTLLLAQPRALAPAELVALDAWVRRGGRAVILADPLLHWPDPRPLGAPQRAPLTSLLDPLLTHWGLKLEPAQVALDRDPVERRALGSGALLQLSGASRFSPVGEGGACAPEEEGLVARCRLGRGEALLVADADWINDTLWTLRPEHPEDRDAWTSATLDVLAAWLTGEAPRVAIMGSWLVDRDALLSALRAALGLLVLLVIAEGLVGRRPSLSQSQFWTNKDHRRNKKDTQAPLPIDTT